MVFRPLEGIRVVDVTSSLAGPTSTEILGGLGADIVKVEHPGRGDEARAWGPAFFEGDSVMFFAANRSKRSLALDFKDERGKEVLLRLIDGADVFVQSMRAGAARRHGLDSETLRARNDRLVTCSIGAFGPNGPLAAQPGYDPLMQAFAGIISITGEPERPGVRVGASLIDIGTGVWAALGILAALYERMSTGRGRDVGVALFDTALSLVGYQLAAALRSGVPSGRFGTAFPLIVPYEAFATADGQLMIAAANDGLFRRLCERLGLPELAADARFATNPDRLAHRDELLIVLRERLAQETSAYWLDTLEGVPVAPVQDLVEVGAHPQTRANGMLQAVEGIEAIAAPLQVDGKRLEHRLPPPRLGQHSAELLRELGYSDADVEALVRDGVVGSRP
jgi:crotonobetainyl-CoA:carnitine CoA-transferase CaiB-like acyl-CoA transferase